MEQGVGSMREEQLLAVMEHILRIMRLTDA